MGKITIRDLCNGLTDSNTNGSIKHPGFLKLPNLEHHLHVLGILMCKYTLRGMFGVSSREPKFDTKQTRNRRKDRSGFWCESRLAKQSVQIIKAC